MKVYKLRVQSGNHVSNRLGTCKNNRWYGADGKVIPTMCVIERHPASASETKDFTEIWEENH